MSCGPFGILARLRSLASLTHFGSNRGFSSLAQLQGMKKPPRPFDLGGFDLLKRSARDSNPQALSGARFRGECNTILPALQNGSAPTVLGGHPPER